MNSNTKTNWGFIISLLIAILGVNLLFTVVYKYFFGKKEAKKPVSIAPAIREIYPETKNLSDEEIDQKVDEYIEIKLNNLEQ